MSLIPLGVSGSLISSEGSNSYTSLELNFGTLAVSGAVYELSRWRGFSLRHLSFSFVHGANAPILGGIYLTNQFPRSLHPNDIDPQALWATFVYTDTFGGMAKFDFEPGLIWVGPGETIYIVVCDLMSSSPTSANTGKWKLNILWEPYER